MTIEEQMEEAIKRETPVSLDFVLAAAINTVLKKDLRKTAIMTGNPIMMACAILIEAGMNGVTLNAMKTCHEEGLAPIDFMCGNLQMAAASIHSMMTMYKFDDGLKLGHIEGARKFINNELDDMAKTVGAKQE